MWFDFVNMFGIIRLLNNFIPIRSLMYIIYHIHIYTLKANGKKDRLINALLHMCNALFNECDEWTGGLVGRYQFHH